MYFKKSFNSFLLKKKRFRLPEIDFFDLIFGCYCQLLTLINQAAKTGPSGKVENIIRPSLYLSSPKDEV